MGAGAGAGLDEAGLDEAERSFAFEGWSRDGRTAVFVQEPEGDWMRIELEGD